MATAHDKGSALEFAVRAIEQAILTCAPGYSEKTFRIEQRKIITMAGVRHELDLWVSVDLGSGYEAIFIFECRNREEKVDKNDIIVLAEKIKVAQAQTGFFVAKSFTADAEAQAALDQRIRLLRVAEFPADAIPMPVRGISVEATHGSIGFMKQGAKDGDPFIVVDPATARWMIDDACVDLDAYVMTWLTTERDRRVEAFRAGIVDEGVHELQFDAERVLGSSKATLNGMPIERERLRGRVRVRVTRPTMVSHFEVASRGRVLTGRIEVGGQHAAVALVADPVA